MNTLWKALLISALCFSAVLAAPQDSTCDSCTYVVGVIESWVESNSTVEEIDQLLDTWCSFVPQFNSICDQLVQFGVAELIQLIQQSENPTQVCTQIGLCTSSSLKTKVRDTNCFLCEQVIGAIEGWIDSQSTIQEIESNLQTLCSFVPGFSATCDAIIDAGVPSVVNWIITAENSTVVCTQLGLCGSSRPKVIPKPKARQDDPNCDICKTLIYAIEGWMAENKTETTIENDLEKYFCAVAGPFQFVCDAIAEKGVPTVVDWIEQNESPLVVCQQLGLCANSTMPYVYNNKFFIKSKLTIN
jgi:saposin